MMQARWQNVSPRFHSDGSEIGSTRILTTRQALGVSTQAQNLGDRFPIRVFRGVADAFPDIGETRGRS